MAKDPYKYFRIEAREHIEALSSGVLALEKRGDDQELINRLLRHAHTLKGAARVVRQVEISKLSHAIEELLGTFRDGQGAADRQNINQLLQMIDAMADHTKALDVADESSPTRAAAGGAGTQKAESAAAPLDSIRIALSELDPVLYGVWELGIQLRALREQVGRIDQAFSPSREAFDDASDPTLQHAAAIAPDSTSVGLIASSHARSSSQELRRRLLAVVDKAEREVMQLQDRMTQLRLLPASSLFASLERAARDTADALGKQVEFRTSGGDNRLDAHVLRGIHEALLHLIRNAVSHGIESPPERLAAGKPAAGQVELEVARSGNHLVFTCRDDGRGLDTEQIQRAAAVRGLLPGSDQTPLTQEQAIQLLLGGGITTAADVTEHAGRGIGLNVVRETVTQLEGALKMHSPPSGGTIVRMTVPVSLEAMIVLELEVAGHRTSIPFTSVRRVLQASEKDIARSVSGDSIVDGESPLRLLSLQSLLFPELPGQAASADGVVLVIEANRKCVAVLADRICARKTVVLKPIPAVVEKIEVLLGACLDAAGDPLTVLDPNAVVEASVTASSGTAAVPKAKLPVLVIDDSLTTRMLEQSILETAGYDVDLAVSAEQALGKARQRKYAIFIVDVEMPGMNGYEFIAKTQLDPDLRRTPAILVTSRGAPEDRARGEAAGAAGYIVKSEFEESRFLATIRRLTG